MSFLNKSLLSFRSCRLLSLQKVPLEGLPVKDNLNDAKHIYDEVNEIIDKDHIKYPIEERLFAIVFIAGHQRKVTVGDLLNVRMNFNPKVGQLLSLKKILLIAGPRFSIIGRPLISNDLAKVTARVVEKSLSHIYMAYDYKPGKNYENMSLDQEDRTMLKIVSVKVSKNHVC